MVVSIFTNPSNWMFASACAYIAECLYALSTEGTLRYWIPYTLLPLSWIFLLSSYFTYHPLFSLSCKIRSAAFPLFVAYIIIFSGLAFFFSWDILTDINIFLFAFSIQESLIGGLIYYLLFVKQAKLVKTSINIDNEQKEVLEIGSAIATMRLLKDLKSISKKKPEQLGFSVEPAIDKFTGMENIYHWLVTFSHFDPKTPLGQDLKRSNGKISLEVRFSADYPYVPPFVRVIKPRFQFRTGHVTVGGSVCMEILTMSGWNSSNDIESLLLQIRQGLIDGGARLESGYNNVYSESEAWSAFYRAAVTHNWKVSGLTPNKFPKTTV